DIELILLLGEYFNRIADVNFDSFRDPCALKVSLRLFGVFSIAVGVMHLATFTHGTCPPDCRVADGRSQLKNLPGAADQCQLMKEVTHGRANDRNTLLGRFSFHLDENFIAGWKKRVQVVVHSRFGDVAVMSPAGSFWLSCHCLPPEPATRRGRKCV